MKLNCEHSSISNILDCSLNSGRYRLPILDHLLPLMIIHTLNHHLSAIVNLLVTLCIIIWIKEKEYFQAVGVLSPYAPPQLISQSLLNADTDHDLVPTILTWLSDALIMMNEAEGFTQGLTVGDVRRQGNKTMIA